METLYTLTGDYLNLMQLADSTDPEDEQAFIDTLDGILGAIDIKADQYAAVMSEISGRKGIVKAEIDRLTAVMRALSNHEDRMKEALYGSMIATDRREIKTDLHTFKIVKNGGKLPLIIEDGADIPDKYCKVTIEPDKDKIRTALETGNVLDFAHFGERGEHLSIK